MVGIDDVSMNIINDDRTPVRATAVAQGVNVARASVQLPDPLCSHWQTDLNRFVACEYQLFRTESFVKKKKMEALLQTCGENISLSIPPEASFPGLLGKLKGSEGKYRSLEEKLKATKQQAFISVSNAEKTLSPAIDGHEWQITETSKKNAITNFNKFLEYELQSGYFKNKTAVSGESMSHINENDIILCGDRRFMSERVTRIVDEVQHAHSHHRSGTDDTSRLLKNRLILKVIDELRHSVDGKACRLIKSVHAMVSRNGHLVNVIQYFELNMTDAMNIINNRLRRKDRR